MNLYLFITSSFQKESNHIQLIFVLFFSITDVQRETIFVTAGDHLTSYFSQKNTKRLLKYDIILLHWLLRVLQAKLV